MKKYNLGFGTVLLSLLFFCATIREAQAITFTFSNPSPITINDFGPASPYPLTATVTGINVPILDLNVVVNGLSHTFPSDIGILLVGPGGQKVVLMNQAGGFTPITNVTLTFDDEASSSLPFGGPITSGSYKPTDFAPTDTFAPPSLAAGPYSSSLSAFDGTLPNGVWSLFVRDFSAGDSGLISGGFGLQVTTPEPSTFLLFGAGLISLAYFLRRRLHLS